MSNPEEMAPTAPPERGSVWDLMLGVLVSPSAAMDQIARERLVVPAAVILAGLSLFTMLVGILSSDGGDWEGAVQFWEVSIDPAVMERIAQRFAVMASVVGAAIRLIWWVVRAAVYRLLGELLGTEGGDGKALLATLGFAAMPGLLAPPLQLAASSLDLTPLSMLAGVIIWLWSAFLAVLAIRASLKTSAGRAVAIFAIPWAVLVGLGILTALVMGFALVALADTF